MKEEGTKEREGEREVEDATIHGEEMEWMLNIDRVARLQKQPPPL